MFVATKLAIGVAIKSYFLTAGFLYVPLVISAYRGKSTQWDHAISFGQFSELKCEKRRAHKYDLREYVKAGKEYWNAERVAANTRGTSYKFEANAQWCTSSGPGSNLTVRQSFCTCMPTVEHRICDPLLNRCARWPLDYSVHT
ncbi:unnamed protein product [Rodentolepis nana]|uniref:Cytochrome c oxidase assembly protein COX16 homolog, mitochondrial n=1 Tax=Rodentolepis nana TaxID=102285 RepID=A0A0R3TGR2_RODNA|nr:unnamed protein product [Rodentolepis nana]